MVAVDWFALIVPFAISVVVVCFAVSAGRWFAGQWHKTIIYSHEQGLLYRDGKLQGLLKAGRHSYFGTRNRIDVQDMRKRSFSVNGQEILTKDHAGLRLTVVGFYQIVDLERAQVVSENFVSDLYSLVQLAMRKAVSAVTLDELLADKSQLDTNIQKEVAQNVSEIGLNLTDLAVLDVMLPAHLKKAYSGVLEAQKEAQKNLEKARGEQAVLRSLANSAKLYQENPSLLQARIIQALATGNNSIVFGTDEKIIINKGT